MQASAAAGRSARALVIVGASVRALAESAHRAGWDVHAADLYRDLDLAAVAREAVRVAAARDDGDGYPRGLAAAAASFPARAPWCYTGGLENHPDLLASIAAARPLAGNPADVVVSVRDPGVLADAVTSAGLAFPATMRSPDGLPTDGSFLIKPLASAGGRGIRIWDTTTAAGWLSPGGARSSAGHCWQRIVAGTPVSAAYVMSPGASRLLGISRQLIGAAWCHAPRFAWCGGVTLDRSDLRDAFERLGVALAERFRPVGAIGIDAVVDDRGTVSVLEVNPRPTASMELFERSDGTSIAASHLAACGQPAAVPPTVRTGRRGTAWHWAKAVLFASRDVAVTPALVARLRDTAAGWTAADGGWAALADIPAPDQTITAGSPACTIFARANRPEDALHALRDRVAAAELSLGSAAPCGTAPD
jgi:predicted ATP-grasp superfamily ATP-dependent carboligase